MVEEPVVATPSPPPEEPKAIQRVNTIEEQKKCHVSDEEDGSRMVFSAEYDWYLYVSQTAEVECGTFGGNATIRDGALTIRIKSLVPSVEGDGDAEQLLREQSVGFVKTELAEQSSGASGLTFVPEKLGRSKRPALCVESDLDLKGTPGKVVACVTSKKNINDEVVVHRVVWVGPADSYDSKATVKLVKEAAANWYRRSDTDGMGKLLRPW